MSLILAAVALTGAVLALRRAWAGGGHRIPGLVVAGILLVTAMMLSAEGAGWERGVALASIASAVPAFAVVAVKATWRPRRPGADRGNADDPAPTPRLWLRWLLAGPAAALAAAGSAAVVATWLPAVPGTRMIWAGLSVPLVWAALAGWGLATARPAHVLAIASACAFAGAGLAAVPFLA